MTNWKKRAKAAKDLLDYRAGEADWWEGKYLEAKATAHGWKRALDVEAERTNQLATELAEANQRADRLAESLDATITERDAMTRRCDDWVAEHQKATDQLRSVDALSTRVAEVVSDVAELKSQVRNLEGNQAGPTAVIDCEGDRWVRDGDAGKYRFTNAWGDVLRLWNLTQIEGEFGVRERIYSDA